MCPEDIFVGKIGGGNNLGQRRRVPLGTQRPQETVHIDLSQHLRPWEVDALRMKVPRGESRH